MDNLILTDEDLDYLANAFIAITRKIGRKPCPFYMFVSAYLGTGS